MAKTRFGKKAYIFLSSSSLNLPNAAISSKSVQQVIIPTVTRKNTAYIRICDNLTMVIRNRLEEMY